MRILAVDDDRYIRELLAMILAEIGDETVTVACSADDALAAIDNETETFECFLLDIQMPGMDGIELCSKIRQLPEYRATPIIMLTAMHEKSFIDSAFAAGATDYATKPFEIPELHARLRMAKLLVEEQRRLRDLVADTETDIPPKKNFESGFSECLQLDGVKGLVSSAVFANYLAQLSRSGLQSSTFFAIHIMGGKAIFDRSASSEFEYALHHVADAIISAQRSRTVILYYAGSGNFLCSGSALSQTSEQFESDIQDALDEKDLTYDDGLPLDIQVAVGASVQPFVNEAMQVEDLEALAVKRAVVRAIEKQTQPKPVNVRSVRF